MTLKKDRRQLVSRTWADVGLGADLELNNNSYFFLDMERAFGNGVSRTWQVNGGFRWEWK